MSWTATSYVKKLKTAPTGQPITKAEKLVLFVLADYHNEERGDAWASLSHLADESLHTRSGLVRTLRGLEAKGVLVVVRDPGAAVKRVTNRYRFPELDPSPSVVTGRQRSLGLVTPGYQTSDPGSPGTSDLWSPDLVTPGHQTSDPGSPGLVTPGHHIFPDRADSLSFQGQGGGQEPDDPRGLWVLAEKILEFLNAKTGRRYQARKPNKEPTSSLRLIHARLKDGYSEQQLRQVIGNRLVKWQGDPKMDEFLRPETLFGPKKFDQYLGQIGAA